ncbi:riboflavin synthase subunit beta [Flavobacteriaceae bacterium]|jgi:hypothetical protein|nr:riboflavin synthase subunit beta [Flavobacteriaceae bacterium]
MGIFKTKQNKKYNYTPRFYKGERSPFEIKHKFDDHRVTIQKTNLKGKINNAVDDLKTNHNTSANRRVSIIILILIFVFLWIIDFDLSIFF